MAYDIMYEWKRDTIIIQNYKHEQFYKVTTSVTIFKGEQGLKKCYILAY